MFLTIQIKRTTSEEKKGSKYIKYLLLAEYVCFISIILRNTSQKKLSRLYNYDYDSISSFIFMAKSDIEIGLEAKHFTFSLWNSLLNSS